MALISDEALRAALREQNPGEHVELVSRRALTGDIGGSGAIFERVAIALGDTRHECVLKVIEHDAFVRTTERHFYETVAATLTISIPRCLASGPAPGREDGWILLEAFPRPRQRSRWRDVDHRAVLRELAQLHAETLGAVPSELARPFGRDIGPALAHVEAGAASLRELARRIPIVSQLAADDDIDEAVHIAQDPAVLVEAFCALPESLVHRDFHPGNVSVPRAGRPILFDWETPCGGPGAFDVAVYLAYLPLVWFEFPRLGWQHSRWRPGSQKPAKLRAHYISALEQRLDGAVDAAALHRAIDAGVIFEAVYRIGWIHSRLASIERPLANAPHEPGLGQRLALWRADAQMSGFKNLAFAAPMFSCWSSLFRGLPARVAALRASG